MVTEFVARRYVFHLMITDDKGLNGVDTTSMLVNPAPIQTMTVQPTANPYEYTLALINGVDHTGLTDKNISLCMDNWRDSFYLPGLDTI